MYVGVSNALRFVALRVVSYLPYRKIAFVKLTIDRWINRYIDREREREKYRWLERDIYIRLHICLYVCLSLSSISFFLFLTLSSPPYTPMYHPPVFLQSLTLMCFFLFGFYPREFFSTKSGLSFLSSVALILYI